MSSLVSQTSVAEPDSSTFRVSWVSALAGALLCGLAFGVLTNLAQGWLPGAWNNLANSGAVWSSVAFVTGAVLAAKVSLRLAAVAGLLAELGLVVGYYGYAEFGFDRSGMGNLTWPLIWIGMAGIAGPLFGVAGRWSRRGRTLLRRTVGTASLAGVFGAEAIAYHWDLRYTAQAVACVAVLILIPLALARTLKGRVLALLTAAAFSLVAYFTVFAFLSNASA
ncbi:DUF6518 family protein [Streptomyces scopuliridis]|uniref:DUF6518 family protein n=1 Tax=Streptomyces scopuliridis TaxID=452529 RepID=UPI00368050A7